MPATGCHIICNWIPRLQNRHNYISWGAGNALSLVHSRCGVFVSFFEESGATQSISMSAVFMCNMLAQPHVCLCHWEANQRLNSKSVSKTGTMTGFAGMCKSPRWLPSRFSLTMVRNHRSIRPLQDTVGAMEYSNRETNIQMSRLWLFVLWIHKKQVLRAQKVLLIRSTNTQNRPSKTFCSLSFPSYACKVQGVPY